MTQTQRNVPAPGLVSEYELTRSRLVVEEETDERDLPTPRYRTTRTVQVSVTWI